MITLIRSECCFLFVLSPAPQFHFRMSAAPRRQDDDDERMRVLCARRLILQWNKYNKEEEEEKKLTSFRCTFGSSRYNKPQRILRPCEMLFFQTGASSSGTGDCRTARRPERYGAYLTQQQQQKKICIGVYY